MSEATVMERLRDETADLHAGAERQEFQRRMAKGEISREEYRRWLGQMLHVHRALEAPLRPLMTGDPDFAALREEQMQEPYLVEDLRALGAEPGPDAPLPATARLLADIAHSAESSPLALLGYHYVLEGSNNGNRFILRALAPALGLDGGGARYLDPYGEAQRENWARFKADMNAVGFSRERCDLLVAAARRMFEAVGEISAELGDQTP